MPDRLLLRLLPDGDFAWLRQSGDGRAPAASTRGLPPRSALEAGEIVVLAPAADVLVTEARLAAKNRAQLLKALPFAVEDQLLAPVEDLHFAAAESGGETIGAAVVAKATLRGWLERLAEAGIEPDVLLPESLALPPGAALIDASSAVVRLAPWSAFACAPGELAAWLERTAKEGAAPLDVHDFRDAPALALPVAATYRERERDPLAFLARSLGRPALNLLAGEFAPKHRAARGARWWRVAAALAAAVVALAVLDLGVEVVQLSRASARMDALAEEAVRQTFPDAEAELARSTPAELVRRRVDALRGGAPSGGFLRLAGAIAPTLGNSSRVQMRGIEFRNGTLELGLRAPDVATLDAVRERLAATPGLAVAVTAANPGADGIDGRIRVSPAASGGGAP